MTNRIWKLLGFLLIACLLLSGVSALAADGTLTVTLKPDSTTGFTFIEGVTFDLYRIGVPDGTTDSAWAPNKDPECDFSMVTNLADAPADESSKEWSTPEIEAIIAKVEGVLADQKFYFATTNASGEASFDLDPGIYYCKKRDESYPKRLEVFPFLIAVPALNTDNPYNVAADLVAEVKYEYTPPELFKLPVNKHWDDVSNFDGLRKPDDIVKVNLERTIGGKKDTDFKVETKELSEANSWSGKWENLERTNEDNVPYIYTVTEESVPYYDPPVMEYTDRDEETGKTEVKTYPDNVNQSDKTISVQVDNPHTPEYGCLEVTKAVTVGGQPTTTNLVDGTYVFTITGPDPDSVPEPKKPVEGVSYLDAVQFPLSIIKGESSTYTNYHLMPGTYTIKEVGMMVNGEIVSLPNNVESSIGSAGVEVTVTANNTEQAPAKLTVTNNLNAGSLTVNKAVTLNGATTTDARLNGTYKFTVTGPTHIEPFEIQVTNGASTPVTLTDLVPGEYTVTESSEGLAAGVSIASGSGVTYTVNAGADTAVTVTNNLGIGSLRIVKTVTVNGVPTTTTRADGTYNFTVKGPSYPSGQKVSITIKNGASSSTQLDNLLVGEYTVSEDTSSLPSGMSLRSTNDLRLNVTGGTVTDASFTNNIGTPTVTPPPNIVVNPTPTPLPNIIITGQKIWNDENNLHNVRPTTITVQLLRNGSVIRETNVTGNMTAERWTYRFTGLPQMNAQGEDYVYTVRELPVTGYTTEIDGFTITNSLIPRTPNEYTNFNGTKTWDDSDNMEGLRPNYIIVRLLRDGVEVDRRTVTGANSWQYTFQNMPLDDGYGYTYEYTIREDAVPGYVGRIDGFNITNSRLPEEYNTPLAGFNEPEMEDLMELYDYETPLWGRPLKTGDDMPLYPIVFGGIGLAALVALAILIVIGKKRGNNAA